MSTEVVLGRGALTVEVALRPFAFTIRRSGRRLVRSGGIWVADGTIRDHFIQLTEGVLAHEEPSPAAHGLRASITSVRTDEAQLDVLLHGGRRARLSIGDRISVSARAHAGPLRVSLFCQRTPAARLRALCHRTGFPQLLPEWGYGFWKSRDVYEHQDDVLDDFSGFRRNQIPLDAVVIDSPWATQYNTWKFNPHQFPDAPATIARMRADGVRTVVWVTPWVNLDSRDGQIPPQPESERLHRQPAPNYESGAAAGHFVRLCSGEPLVAQWWMGTGSTVDFTSGAAESWWRAQAKGVLELGVEGIKADDGEGYYVPDDVQLSDGRTGAEAAWTLGGLHRACLQRALEETHGANGVLFGRSGWTGQHAVGITWAGDQASDFWSLRVLVISALAAACSGLSNFSHDIGGYLGHRLVERCPAELLVRWIQFGCFTPLMQAHGRMPQEPWQYGDDVLALYRGYVLPHEQLTPYVRAAARTAARTGLPIIRPLCLVDPEDLRGWAVPDAYGYGPSLWVAPVLDEGAREREVTLPRGDWIETWSGAPVQGGGEAVVDAPLHLIPVWVRPGSIIVTYPAEHVATGLGDTPERERPLEATLWGHPRLGHAAASLTDGTRIRWREGEWSVSPEREVTFRTVTAAASAGAREARSPGQAPEARAAPSTPTFT
jgi:alpha-glucosidase (family GH31 glycosyl hydrolase)